MSFTPSWLDGPGEGNNSNARVVSVRVMNDNPLTPMQRAQLGFNFDRHMQAVRLSTIGLHNRQGTLQDGSPFRIVSNSGLHIVEVWPVAGGESSELVRGIGVCVTALDGQLLPSLTLVDSTLGSIPQPLLLIPGVKEDGDELTSDGNWNAVGISRLAGGQRLWRGTRARRWLSAFSLPSTQQPPGRVVDVGPVKQTDRDLHHLPAWSGDSILRIRFDPPESTKYGGSLYNFHNNDTVKLRATTALEPRDNSPSFVGTDSNGTYVASAFSKTFDDGSTLIELMYDSLRAFRGLWREAIDVPSDGAYIATRTVLLSGAGYGFLAPGAISANASGTQIVGHLWGRKEAPGGTPSDDYYVTVDMANPVAATQVQAGVIATTVSTNTLVQSGETSGTGWVGTAGGSWGPQDYGGEAGPRAGYAPSYYPPWNGITSVSTSRTTTTSYSRSYAETKTKLNRVFFDYDDVLVKEQVVEQDSVTFSHSMQEDTTAQPDANGSLVSIADAIDLGYGITTEVLIRKISSYTGTRTYTRTLATSYGTFVLDQKEHSTSFSGDITREIPHGGGEVVSGPVTYTLDFDEVNRKLLLYDRKMKLAIYLETHSAVSGSAATVASITGTTDYKLKVSIAGVEVFSETLHTRTDTRASEPFSVLPDTVVVFDDNTIQTNSTTVTGTRQIYNPLGDTTAPYSVTYYTSSSNEFSNSETSGPFHIGSIYFLDAGEDLSQAFHVYCARDPVTLAYAVNVQLDEDVATAVSAPTRNWFWLFDSTGMKNLHTLLDLAQAPVVWEPYNLNSLVSV